MIATSFQRRISFESYGIMLQGMAKLCVKSGKVNGSQSRTEYRSILGSSFLSDGKRCTVLIFQFSIILEAFVFLSFLENSRFK